MLAKIVGVYKIKITTKSSQKINMVNYVENVVGVSDKTEKIYVIVMENANIDNNKQYIRTYDLKGSNINRYIKKKNIAYDQLPMLYFNMNASESSDEILKMADADHIENTGGQVYRGKRIYVERYYQYLLENGYENQTYITTGSYMDAYFTKDEETYRFLYIKKTDDTGVLVFGSCDSKMPDSIDKILKDN